MCVCINRINESNNLTKREMSAFIELLWIVKEEKEVGRCCFFHLAANQFSTLTRPIKTAFYGPALTLIPSKFDSTLNWHCFASERARNVGRRGIVI